MDSWRAISDWLSPEVLSTANVLIFSLFGPVGIDRGLALVFGLGLLILVPFASTTLSYKKGKTTRDIERKDRFAIYESWLPYFLFGAFLFLIVGSHLLFVLAIGFAEVTALLWFLNKFTKASLHAGGVAGGVTPILFVFGWEWAWLYLLVALVGFSRVKLKKHTVIQVVLGAVAGAFCTALVYAVLL